MVGKDPLELKKLLSLNFLNNFLWRFPTVNCLSRSFIKEEPAVVQKSPASLPYFWPDTKGVDFPDLAQSDERSLKVNSQINIWEFRANKSRFWELQDNARLPRRSTTSCWIPPAKTSASIFEGADSAYLTKKNTLGWTCRF